MIDKLKQIKFLAKDLLVDVQLIEEANASKRSSMRTMCQAILDEAYSLELELGRMPNGTDKKEIGQ